MAPAVPPGRYGVRVTVGDGHEMTAVGTTQVEVRRNPWIEGVEGVMREVEAFLEREFEAVNERLRATGGDAIIPGRAG